MATRFVGERIKRREDANLLTGRAVFIDDIELSDMLHGAVLRSTHASARILSIDTSMALALPGIHAVLTHDDLGTANDPMPLLNDDPGFIYPRTHRALAKDQVRFVGEPIAFVIGETRYLCEDALDLINVRYDVRDAAVDVMAAAADGAPLVHDDTESNIACRTINESGDVSHAFEQADVIVREVLRPERGAAQPIETRGVVAEYNSSTGHLTVWDSTQMPVGTRGVLAEKLAMAEGRITVIAPEVGGGFGVKLMLLYAEELLVPFAARLLGQPVKWIEDRQEHFLGSNHERLMVHEIALAADKDGILLGLDDTFYFDSGAYCPYGPINAICCQGILPGPYKIPNLRLEYNAVYTNTVTVGPYRGAGQPHGAFVMETMMNRLAHELKMDPAVLRQRNLVTPAECPFYAGTVFQNGAKLIHQDCDYPAELDIVLKALDYDAIRATQDELRQKGTYRGVAIAFYVEGTGIAPYEGVEIRIEPTGFIHVTTGYPAQGQGHHTSLAQIVAEALCTNLDMVVIESGRTDTFAWGVGTLASRSAVIGGTAAVKAAAKVREKALALAATQLEAAIEDLELAAGAVQVKGVPGHAVGLGELAARANPIFDLEPDTEPGLRATEYYRPQGAEYANGVHGAIIDVDIETGVSTIRRYVAVHDCGNMINPNIVEGQVRGGVAQGIGGALYEKILFDEDGQLLTTTFMDYLIPSTMEIPDIEIHHLDRPSSRNPLGVKGVGEGGAIAAPAVCAAAVEDALRSLDVKCNAVPLRPAHILALINKRKTH